MTLNTPQYTIRIRDNTLAPVGALSAWDAGDVLLRMNDVGKWALTVRADDPLRQYFTRGAGVIISRDRGDGTGAQVIMSGPIWLLERKGRENTFTIAGPTDEWWLKARRALPAGGRPYMEAALLDSPLRYYRLGEASGTTAVDISGKAQNGTYVGAPTLGVAGSITGDPDTAITLNGTSQYITVPTSGLPSGNVPCWLKARFKIGVNPTGTVRLWHIGNTTNGQWLALTMDSGGHVFAHNGTATGGVSSPVALNAWHTAVAYYDGAALHCFLDGVEVGLPTTSATTITLGACTIGAFNAGASGFFPGSLDEVSIGGGAYTAAQAAADYAAANATHGAYDTRTGIASTVLLGYVSANLTSPINVDRDLVAMTNGADPGVGSTVTGNARGDELLALLQQLASAGSDIGYRVVQTSNTALQFQVYLPTDRSGNAKFSTDLQNLFDYSYSLAGPNANYEMVWGGGNLAGRTSVPARDTTSITNWGLVEALIDARDTSDVPTMQQRGQAEINAQAEQTNLALTPRDTDLVQFGRDYFLGDIVAVTVDGNTITNKIRSVHIQLASPDQEIVTPGVGNPTQGDVARWFDAYAARQQALNRVQNALNRLNTAQ